MTLWSWGDENMVFKVSINDREVLASENQTILEVAQENGIYIPTLCYHPSLSKAGACRVCLVEVKGAPNLAASCSTPVSKDMVIYTNSERASKARRLVVELLLANHEIDCLTCESNGNCELQKLAYEIGLEKDMVRFEIQEPKRTLDDSSPVIIRDHSKCVLCGRCVRACQEVTLKGVLGFADRGHDMFVAAGIDQSLVETDCASCGACVQVCPVGALVDKMARFKGRIWELDKTTTTCAYCGVGCTLDLYTKGNEVVKVAGNQNGPDNQGLLCVKGRYGYDFINSKDRLTSPLIKRNDRFEAATWDEALDLVASKLTEIKQRYGSNALAGLASAKCTNEENYLFQKFVRTCFGTNNVDHCARLCHASTLTALNQSFGSGAMTNSIREILKADVILVTGSNTTENHPVIGFYIKQAVRYNGTKLIVIDPRRIELVEWSSLWLRPRSGTDVAYINGLMNVILNEGLHDRSFIETRCENFDELREVVSQYTPEKVEEITGIPAPQLIEAARTYAKSEKSMILFAMGITQHVTGVDNVLSIANLAMLSGKIGRESTGVNPLRGQNNVQGSCDMGALPDYYPGYQKVVDEKAREKMEKAWGRKLDGQPGLTLTEMIKASLAGRLKGLYIMGENPMMTDPNINHVKKALENLDFLVVQDIFMTETAGLADVVLPSASFAEKEGTFTNTGRRIQRVRKAINPVGESLPDWQIIIKVANKMGYEMNYNGPANIMEEIAQVTPIYGGVSHDRLERVGLQWPCPDRKHPGTKILHVNGFTRGKGRLIPVHYRPPAEVPDSEYPFLLTTGRILYHYHSGSMTRRSRGLNSLSPECLVEMNPLDVSKMGLKDGDVVRVSSRRGELEAKLKMTERSAPGMVFIPFHFNEAAANLLTNDAVDPQAKIPEYKVAAVRVAKVYP